MGMGTVTTEQLAEWERLADEATEGPWAVDAIMDDSETEIILGYEIPNAGSPIMLAATFDDDDEGPGRITPREGRNNARFIAASRIAVPLLIQRIRELEKELANATH